MLEVLAARQAVGGEKVALLAEGSGEGEGEGEDGASVRVRASHCA